MPDPISTKYKIACTSDQPRNFIISFAMVILVLYTSVNLIIEHIERNETNNRFRNFAGNSEFS